MLDINECGTVALCDPNATCTDTFGSYECSCNLGFMGNGITCEGMIFFSFFIHYDKECTLYFRCQ